MSDIFIDTVTRSTARKMAEAAFKSLTDAVTDLQQKVELKTKIHMILDKHRCDYPVII